MKAKFFGGIADGQSMEVDTNNIVISVQEMERQRPYFLSGDIAPSLPSFIEQIYHKERWRMQTRDGIIEWVFYVHDPIDLEGVEKQIIRAIAFVFETEGKNI